MNKHHKEDHGSFGDRGGILNNLPPFDKPIKPEDFTEYSVGCFLIA